MPIDVHPDRPNSYSPIHSDDYIEKIVTKETTRVLNALCAEANAEVPMLRRLLIFHFQLS